MPASQNQRNPVPALSPADRELLKASLQENGQLANILRSAGPAMKGQIVDGHHREEILSELKIKPRYEDRPFATEAEFRIAQIDANLARRQLTLPQRIELARQREPWLRQQAEARMKAGGKASGEAGRTAEIAAQSIGVSRQTFERGKFILERAPREIKQKFESGELSVNRAFTEARRAIGEDARTVLARRVVQRTGELPAGKYAGIVIAPPWRTTPMRFEKGRFLPNEIATLEIPEIATRDAIVCLWTNGMWLREAYDVMERWHASVFSVVTWVLDESTATETLRDRTRFGLLATFGKVPAASRKTNLIMGGNGFPLNGDAYAIVDELAPGTSRIALFAETRRAGWKAWSPEVDE